MRLFIDRNYTPPVIKLLTALQNLQYPKVHEVVTEWSDDFKGADTIVFLIDTNKVGLNILTTNHLADGYNVVAFKKPAGDAFDPYTCSLSMLSHWRKIFEDLSESTKKKLILIGKGKSYKATDNIFFPQTHK